MLVLAIVLLVLVGALVVISFAGGGEQVVIDMGNVTITTSVGAVFVSGVLAGVIALLSVVAIRISLRRRSRHSKELKALRKRAEQTDAAAAGTAATGDAPGAELDRPPSDSPGDALPGDQPAESAGPRPDEASTDTERRD